MKYFPFKDKKPYPNQVEIIKNIASSFADDKKFVFVEAPCGSGKSAIAMTIANMLGSAYYVTITKILQDQLEREFGHPTLKGRNNYHCNFWEHLLVDKFNSPKEINSWVDHPTVGKSALKSDNLNCSEGPCKILGQSSCNRCMSPDGDYNKSKCEYFVALGKVIKSPISVLNLKAFIHQMKIENRFNHRRLLIIDEVHNLESEFLNITSLTLNKFNTGIDVPFYKTSEEYHKFFTNINLLELLMQRQADAIASGDTRKFDEYEDLIFKYKIFNSSQDDMWLQDYENDKFPQITFKPLYVKKIIKKFLTEYCDYVLLMSATILNAKVFRDSMGISQNECVFYKMNSTFDVDKRLIYYQPVGKMNYKNKPETMPKIISKIDEICDKYKGKKGIIHSHSFEISDYIKENIKNKNRILYQKDFKSKEELIEKHFKSKDSIILAPAMHEGISLNDDHGRFAIVVKVPYPSFINNSQLKARMEIDRNHYNWLTLTKLLQSVGRCVRSHTDYADTYIIDGDFSNFYEETEKNMPKWFKESLVWPKD